MRRKGEGERIRVDKIIKCKIYVKKYMWNIEIQLYIQFSDRSGTAQTQVFVIQHASSTEHSGLEEVYYICEVYIHAIYLIILILMNFMHLEIKLANQMVSNSDTILKQILQLSLHFIFANPHSFPTQLLLSSN